jgi:hypothetical protein
MKKQTGKLEGWQGTEVGGQRAAKIRGQGALKSRK